MPQMQSGSAEPLVWLDMEMTGLDPETCVPIEVAVIVTTADLAELATMEAVIHQPEEALESMIDLVREMHTSNGLLPRVRASRVSLAEAEERMIAALDGLVVKGSAILAGNSIPTDRRFIDRYFPAFAAWLHYRMVNVTSLKELVRRWYGEEALPAKPESDHTALSDVRASIAELAHYRRTVMRERS